MNERIQQLAEQAGILKEQTVKAKIVKNEDGTWTSILEYPDLEKFANLIIQECNNLNKQVLTQSNLGHYMVIERIMKKYQDHFGVEE